MPINRLFEIVYSLLNRKSVTAQELAERFEVSVRTIYRDIDTLSAAGVPVYASQGKGGGISLLADYVLDKSLLSAKEQNEILYALQSLAVTQTPEADKLLAKLGSLFNQSSLSWLEVDFSPWGSAKDRSNQFAVLQKAILNRKILEFSYFNSAGEKGRRRVEPLKLLFRVKAWYLQGFCLTKNAYRTFKISRMSEVLLTPESCAERLPQALTEAERERSQKWVDLCLRLSARGAYWVYDEFKEKDVLKNEDGSFIISTSLPESKWLVRYILSFGADMEVLAPQTLRALVESELNAIMNNYLPPK